MKRIIALLLFFTLLFAGCELTVSMQQPTALPADSDGLTVHFIDVGQADSILLLCERDFLAA